MSYSNVEVGSDMQEMEMPMILIKGNKPNNEFRVVPSMICIEEQLNEDNTLLALHLLNGEVLKVKRDPGDNSLELVQKYYNTDSYYSAYKN